MLGSTQNCQQCGKAKTSPGQTCVLTGNGGKKKKGRNIFSRLVLSCGPAVAAGPLRARGARRGPCDTGCPGCWPRPPGCWLCSLRPQTEPGCGGGSWWPWRPSGLATPAAGSPCSLVGRPGTEAWTCPPGSSCARRWSRRGGPPSGCRRPAGDTRPT